MGSRFHRLYGFTQDNLGVKGHSNFINYISKYITKSLDLSKVKDVENCHKVSDLPQKYRTAVWTILNNLIWNSQIWIISKAFKGRVKKIEERIEKLKSNWMWIDTVSKENPRFYEWMRYKNVFDSDTT